MSEGGKIAGLVAELDRPKYAIINGTDAPRSDMVVQHAPPRWLLLPGPREVPVRWDGRIRSNRRSRVRLLVG